jgi:hypothetical protein
LREERDFYKDLVKIKEDTFGKKVKKLKGRVKELDEELCAKTRVEAENGRCICFEEDQGFVGEDYFEANRGSLTD